MPAARPSASPGTLCRWAAATALGCLFHAAHAQRPTDVQACLGLANDSERLACYDRLAGRDAMLALPTSPAAAASATQAASTGPTTGIPPQPAAPAGTAAPRASSDSFLSRYWELDPADKRGTFNYTAYRPNVFLPLRVMKSVNRQPSSPTRGVATGLPKYQNSETKLQLSLRTKVLEDVLLPGADLWVTYTQQSIWQTWNRGQSSPFRNTDYQPEVLYVIPMPAGLQRLPFGWTWRMSSVGLVHQSNGQADELSRSWNRAYALVGLEKDDLTLSLRVESPLAKSSDKYDDNPDIEHHLGHLQAQLNWASGRSISSLVWRPSLHGRGSVELNWSYPVYRDRPDGLRWYVQAFHGYGETLLDYNFRQTSLGMGLSIFKF